MDSDPLQQCDNCMKDFPESKIATHFGYCRRNIKKCQTCQEMFDINFKEEHEEEFHSKQKCPHCSIEFPSKDCKQHQNKCKSKPKFCEYCQLNVPVTGFETHYKACQSRTKPCTRCNKPIMNKDYLIHSVSCDGIVEAPRKPTNYQQQIIQQQQKREENYFQNQIEKKSEAIKLKEQKKYTGVIQKNSEQKYVYDPRVIYPSRQEIDKKDSQKNRPSYQREQAINPPSLTPTNGFVRQDKRYNEVRPSGGITYDPKAYEREKAKYNGSNKQIYKNEPIKPTVKDNKPIESKAFVKRQQGLKEKISNQNINPKYQQIKPTYESKNKPPLMRQREQVSRSKSPETKSDYLSNQYALADLNISPEQQMMQEILMQSAKNQKTNINTANLQKNIPKSKAVSNIEIQDLMNESFIQKQRAIEQQFTRKNKGRR